MKANPHHLKLLEELRAAGYESARVEHHGAFGWKVHVDEDIRSKPVDPNYSTRTPWPLFWEIVQRNNLSYGGGDDNSMQILDKPRKLKKSHRV